MAETFDYLKKNMGTSELLSSMGFNALKALITTIPIIGAFLALERVLYPGLTLYSWVVLSFFLAMSVISMVFLIHAKIETFDLVEWAFTNKMDREEMGLTVIFSWFIALVGTFIGVTLKDLFYTLLYLTPLSILPFLAFMYMFRFKYERAGPRVFWCLIYGYGFGAGLRGLGLLLVLLVDVIGWQLTALWVICEILISAFYLYIDLTEWVRMDAENKLSDDQRQERREELDLMWEVYGRILR